MHPTRLLAILAVIALTLTRAAHALGRLRATESSTNGAPPIPPSRKVGSARKLLWTGEHGYCELCIYAVHQVQYGELPSCGGSTRQMSYSSCNQVTQSMLSFAQDVMHLISYGCYKYDAYKGWQTVKPCPAHVICGRLPNIYDTQQQTHCPADYHYRFPHALSSRAPKVFNPLLPYAVAQYQMHSASSTAQKPGESAGMPRFSGKSSAGLVANPQFQAGAQMPQQNPQQTAAQMSQQIVQMAQQMAQQMIPRAAPLPPAQPPQLGGAYPNRNARALPGGVGKQAAPLPGQLSVMNEQFKGASVANNPEFSRKAPSPINAAATNWPGPTGSLMTMPPGPIGPPEKK